MNLLAVVFDAVGLVDLANDFPFLLESDRNELRLTRLAKLGFAVNCRPIQK